MSNNVNVFSSGLTLRKSHTYLSQHFRSNPRLPLTLDSYLAESTLEKVNTFYVDIYEKSAHYPVKIFSLL